MVEALHITPNPVRKWSGKSPSEFDALSISERMKLTESYMEATNPHLKEDEAKAAAIAAGAHDAVPGFNYAAGGMAYVINGVRGMAGAPPLRYNGSPSEIAAQLSKEDAAAGAAHPQDYALGRKIGQGFDVAAAIPLSVVIAEGAAAAGGGEIGVGLTNIAGRGLNALKALAPELPEATPGLAPAGVSVGAPTASASTEVIGGTISKFDPITFGLGVGAAGTAAWAVNKVRSKLQSRNKPSSNWDALPPEPKSGFLNSSLLTTGGPLTLAGAALAWTGDKVFENGGLIVANNTSDICLTDKELKPSGMFSVIEGTLYSSTYRKNVSDTETAKALTGMSPQTQYILDCAGAQLSEKQQQELRTSPDINKVRDIYEKLLKRDAHEEKGSELPELKGFSFSADSPVAKEAEPIVSGSPAPGAIHFKTTDSPIHTYTCLKGDCADDADPSNKSSLLKTNGKLYLKPKGTSDTIPVVKMNGP